MSLVVGRGWRWGGVGCELATFRSAYRASTIIQIIDDYYAISQQFLYGVFATF